VKIISLLQSLSSGTNLQNRLSIKTQISLIKQTQKNYVKSVRFKKKGIDVQCKKRILLSIPGLPGALLLH
jgi:hypothetical protein